MNWIATRYGKDLEIMITENGVSAPKENQKPISEAIKDTFRVQFLNDYITEMWKAIALDGIKVSGYFLWSLLVCFKKIFLFLLFQKFKFHKKKCRITLNGI